MTSPSGWPPLTREERAELDWWATRYQLHAVRAYWPWLEVYIIALGFWLRESYLQTIGVMLTAGNLAGAFQGSGAWALRTPEHLTPELQAHLTSLPGLLRAAALPGAREAEELVPYVLKPQEWTEMGPQLSLYWPGPYGRGGSGAGHVLLCPPSAFFAELRFHPEGPRLIKEMTDDQRTR